MQLVYDNLDQMAFSSSSVWQGPSTCPEPIATVVYTGNSKAGSRLLVIDEERQFIGRTVFWFSRKQYTKMCRKGISILEPWFHCFNTTAKEGV